jgi:hypothetical protein
MPTTADIYFPAINLAPRPTVASRAGAAAVQSIQCPQPQGEPPLVVRWQLAADGRGPVAVWTHRDPAKE